MKKDYTIKNDIIFVQKHYCRSYYSCQTVQVPQSVSERSVQFLYTSCLCLLYFCLLKVNQIQTEKVFKSFFPSGCLFCSSDKTLFQSKYPIEYMNYDQTLINADFHMKIIASFRHDGYVYFLFTITNRILSAQSCSNVVTA